MEKFESVWGGPKFLKGTDGFFVQVHFGTGKVRPLFRSLYGKAVCYLFTALSNLQVLGESQENPFLPSLH